MPGLIDSTKPPQPAKKVPAVMKAGAMSPAVIMEQMKVTPEQKEQLQRIVVAGMKLMFDKNTHQMALDAMQGDGPTEQKLSRGIVALLGVLWQESKGSIPPQLLIPAGMVLLAHAAEFMNKTGEAVTPQQFGAATEMMVDLLLTQAGVDPNQGQPAAQPQGVA